MGTWVEDMGLHSEGFTDEQIAEIDLAKPDALHLWATIQQEAPHLQKIIQAEWPRIERLIPVIRMVLEVINTNQRLGQI